MNQRYPPENPISSSDLSFQRFGSLERTTIVFLHGGGAGVWMWKPVIEQLPESTNRTA